MVVCLWKGLCIGLLFGLPAGAVGALTVQRTLAHGLRAGLLTGLGSSAADCFYACVGAFGLTFLSTFLTRHQRAIQLAGGLLVLWMGVRLLVQKAAQACREPESAGFPALFLSSFLIGITNPAAILTFLFAFSWFEIAGPLPFGQGAALVLGVFSGTFLWWLVLSGCSAALKRKLGDRLVGPMNKLFGALLTGFGLVVLGRIWM